MCTLFVECSLLTETAKDDENLYGLGFAMRIWCRKADDFSGVLLTRMA